MKTASILSVAIATLCGIGLAQEQEPSKPKEAAPAISSNVTVKVERDGVTYVGQALGWDGKQLAILRRDGGLRAVPLKSKDEVEVVSTSFDPYDKAQMKARLKKEFGKRYDVSVTSNCVVVHPDGKSEYWARPFEDFIAGFDFYFEQKGFELEETEFPYIVVVLRSRKDFDRYMHNRANFHSRNVVGFYSRLSNRMVTYDPTAMLRVPDPKKRSWLYDAPTVLHESAHQLAFNRGVHNRFSPPPLWLTEGFAMMFEARGVHQAKDFTTLKDRVGSKRFTALRNLYREGKAKNQIKSLVMNDQLFQKDPELAYPLAWGLAFYLAETQSDAFFEYMQSDAKRANFKPLAPDQRLKDFVSRFGTDFEKLEADLRKYYVGDKKKKSGKK